MTARHRKVERAVKPTDLESESVMESISRMSDFVRKWEAAETIEAACEAVDMDKRRATSMAARIRRKYKVPLRRFPAGARKLADDDRETVRAKLLEIIRETKK